MKQSAKHSMSIFQTSKEIMSNPGFSEGAKAEGTWDRQAK